MNLFMSAYSIEASVISLDDKRLLKQILECEVIYRNWHRAELMPLSPMGYSKHPVIKYYISTPSNYMFAMRYALQCCVEYTYRFKKQHVYQTLFAKEINDLTKYVINDPSLIEIVNPIYVEGKYSTTDHIEVVESFKVKLNKKWSTSKTKPKWTRRSPPSFYTGDGNSQLYMGI